jgi:4-alpha-glucanotransferase
LPSLTNVLPPVDSPQRASGILLHVTSLPSLYGIGDLGPSAYSFADFLTRTDQQIWQVLPLGPVGYGASPYSSLSTFAGNPLLISPEPLLERGLLEDADLAPLRALPDDHVDYPRLVPRKETVLETAFAHFDAHASPADRAAFERFRQANAHWLADYTLYAALKDAHDGAAWYDWKPPLAQRNPEALDRARATHADRRRMHAFWQYLFDQQWSALQAYCHARNIRLFGDLPIYVAPDSADVWANQSLFRLDEHGEPTVVAGVPPDAFATEGQRWGNPIYDWARMQERDYQWWTRRMAHTLNRVDLVRLDHFRGFEAYWEIPASSETAATGEWVEGPGADLFAALEAEIDDLAVVAEDLGVITDDVIALRDRFDFPGMAVLQFAFDGDADSPYLPHNYTRNLVAYTGTHDNNTMVGWWENDNRPADTRRFARNYLALSSSETPLHERALRALMGSVARRVVTPLQDVLGLGAEARMNVPGQSQGNWTWRFTPDQITNSAEERLATLTRVYGRAPRDQGPA